MVRNRIYFREDIMKQGQLKEVIKKEYSKCAKDPIYFLKKYCVVQHPIKGKVPFSKYSSIMGIISFSTKSRVECCTMISFSDKWLDKSK